MCPQQGEETTQKCKYSVEPVLKDRLTGHKSAFSRQLVFGDRFSGIEM